jgi:aminopeptidase N
MLNRSLTRSFVYSLVVFSILGCASGPQIEPRMAPGAQTGKSSILTRESAMYRSRQIHKITYSLWFAVDATSEEFSGRTKILFDVRENAFANINKLRVDFTGGKITSLTLNGMAWDAEKVKDRYNGEWLDIAKGDLSPGQNRLEIAYTHPYSETGNGFYRFKDPEDGNFYFRTDLEPYHANLVFPSFDQPDLKASFEVTVEAPPEWTVIANMPSRRKTKVDSRFSWQFGSSPQMSTYLFALAVGPWKEWKSDADGIPLGLYARQSLAKYVDPAEWFKVTKKGLEFYSEFFGYAYPYAKYDQILIPDMNAGAMENIGAVMFSERAVFRGTPTEEERRGRADTILHEMAHMWFGDLVTMRWWNGLWLNESFATYMASVAMERTGLFSGAPQSFFSGMKRWAYSEDQLPTTHPIEVSVADTNQATANFDGITYGKGAAALKQLHSLLGDEDFKEGLHRYFKRFANRNTALVDFMNVMGQSSDRELGLWTVLWLHSTGYNTISVDLACEADSRGRSKISKLDLVQTAPGFANVIRPHQLSVGLYKKDSSGRLSLSEKSLPVSIDAERASVKDAIGKACPDFVFPNEEDYGYFLANLDPKSLEVAKTSLTRISDPFTRHLVVFTLWEMVKSAKWNVDEFAKAAISWISAETNKTLLEDLSELLANPRNARISVLRLLDGEARTKYRDELHRLARKKAEHSPPGSDLQKIWFKLALHTLSAETADWATKLAQKKAKVSGLKIDPDLRWEILIAIAKAKPVDADVLTLAAKEDSSSAGEAKLLEVKIASPDLAAEFVPMMALDLADPAYPVTKLKKGMRNYLSDNNLARTQNWRPKYFASLEKVAAASDESYYRAFAQYLYPSQCSNDVANETDAWVKSHENAPTAMKVTLRKLAFGEHWCAAIRAGREFQLWAPKPKE